VHPLLCGILSSPFVLSYVYNEHLPRAGLYTQLFVLTVVHGLLDWNDQSTKVLVLGGQVGRIRYVVYAKAWAAHPNKTLRICPVDR